MRAEDADVLKHKGRKAAAWGVHVFTTAGVVVGMAALIAIANGEWMLAFVFMAVSTAIDGLDGTMARKFHVKEIVPNFDGATLDNMVDYFNYVLVPAFFLYEAEFLPSSVAWIALTAMALASAYQFCQHDAKTEEHFFKGFPCYWNVLVFYAFILPMAPWAVALCVAICTVLCFVPLQYVYPSRTRAFRALTLTVTLAWAIVNIVILVTYPDVHPALIAMSLAYVAYYVGISFFLDVRRRVAHTS